MVKSEVGQRMSIDATKQRMVGEPTTSKMGAGGPAETVGSESVQRRGADFAGAGSSRTFDAGSSQTVGSGSKRSLGAGSNRTVGSAAAGVVSNQRGSLEKEKVGKSKNDFFIVL